ncbi:MAG: helix-turn-helix transcriptional regulator [Clostridia bacterium]|nr:helix-turn-helix transcriptional regulator [Clostridia bacterium]
MLFNEKLKKLRKEEGLTQEQLAEKLNVSRQAITKWETGEGVPDIENIKQISNLFNVTIDELLKEEKNINIEKREKYSYVEELEIDHSKHFDINICKIQELNILSTNEEKVRVELLSSENENLNEIFKVEFDNMYNKLDIDIKNNKKIEKVDNVKINFYIPEKYIDEIEVKTKAKTMNVADLEIQKLEFDGEIKYVNVKDVKGEIVLNASKCDIEADYNRFEGKLEVNTINSTSRVQIPKDTKYRTVLKGTKNQFVNEKNDEESTNVLELNGINSKMIILEK